MQTTEADPREIEAHQLVTAFSALVTGDLPNREIAWEMIVQGAAALAIIEGRPALASKLREIADQVEAGRIGRA